MPAKSRFTRLDAFTKTVEDARVRTTSGGIVTIFSLLTIFWLVWGEWVDYRRIVVRPELVVDKGRGEKMEIFMNITFPKMPCTLLTLDVMDVSGDIQQEVMHGVRKVRLSPQKEGSKVISSETVELHTEVAEHLDPEYCGECYGAPAPAGARKPGCCNTCEEVRDAYAAVSWSFGKGEGVIQCQREHYGEQLEAQSREGCRVEGAIRVNKVIGNFHFAPGKSFTSGNVHQHDLVNYMRDEAEHSFTHSINQLRFGPRLPDDIIHKLERRSTANAWGEHHINPLEGTEQLTNEKAFNFMYFVKVVSTAYLPLGWEQRKATLDGPENPYEDSMVGSLGRSKTGSLETHQYSVTSHKRSLMGGADTEDGHKERLHARGGIPGVFFSYDISPMKVINREARTKSFSGFLVGICAVVGGTLTVAAAVDRALYEGVSRVKKLHQG